MERNTGVLGGWGGMKEYREDWDEKEYWDYEEY